MRGQILILEYATQFYWIESFPFHQSLRSNSPSYLIFPIKLQDSTTTAKKNLKLPSQIFIIFSCNDSYSSVALSEFFKKWTLLS